MMILMKLMRKNKLNSKTKNFFESDKLSEQNKNKRRRTAMELFQSFH